MFFVYYMLHMICILEQESPKNHKHLGTKSIQIGKYVSKFSFSSFSLSYLYFTRCYHKTVKSLNYFKKVNYVFAISAQIDIFRLFFVQFPWTAVFNPAEFRTITTNIISSLIEDHWSLKYKHSCINMNLTRIFANIFILFYYAHRLWTIVF